MRRTACAAVAVLLVVSCAADLEPAAPAPTTTTAAVTTTTRPAWCIHYDDWKRAVDEQDEIAARYGSKVTAWPRSVLDDFDAAVDAQIEAGSILWDLTEAGVAPRTWDAQARACR